jgi:hypothetical protein
MIHGWGGSVRSVFERSFAVRTSAVAIVFFAIAAAAFNAQAKTWHVDAAGKADFRTIQAAIDPPRMATRSS